MSWINFVIFNALAPLPELDQISDAGAGKNLMMLTPIRDAEFIACGRANSVIDGQLTHSPVVGSQSVTPAILVHGLFRALQQRGYKIRLHCYQLGLQQAPDFTGSIVDDIVIKKCKIGDEADLIKEHLLPELTRQVRFKELHIIAECGVGGTTFATLWLRHWLDNSLTLPGSTKDALKLARKAKIIAQLQQQFAHFPQDVQLFLDDHQASDPVQRALCALLLNTCDKNNSLQLRLAGGMMFIAPLLAIQTEKIKHKLQIATTRWVLTGVDAQQVIAQLPASYPIRTPITDFRLSAYYALHLYEQGYVVEGCGLGGCLQLAEQLGLSQQQIINSLDAAVKPWLTK